MTESNNADMPPRPYPGPTPRPLAPLETPKSPPPPLPPLPQEPPTTPIRHHVSAPATEAEPKAETQDEAENLSADDAVRKAQSDGGTSAKGEAHALWNDIVGVLGFGDHRSKDGRSEPITPPSLYLALAAMALILAPPVGAVSVYHASKAHRLYSQGEDEFAERRASAASWWAILALAVAAMVVAAAV